MRVMLFETFSPAGLPSERYPLAPLNKQALLPAPNPAKGGPPWAAAQHCSADAQRGLRVGPERSVRGRGQVRAPHQRAINEQPGRHAVVTAHHVLPDASGGIAAESGQRRHIIVFASEAELPLPCV